MTLGVCSVVNNAESALNDDAGTSNFPSYALVSHFERSSCWVSIQHIKNICQKIYTHKLCHV